MDLLNQGNVGEGVTPEVQTPPAENPPQNNNQPNPLEAQLAQLQMQIQQQQQEIANLHSRTQQPQASQNQVEEVSFYSDPQKAIKQQVDNAVAPINQFIQSFQRSQVYQSNKGQVRQAFPNLNNYWNIIEPQLDGIFGNGQVEPSPQNIMTAVNNIVGQLAMRNPSTFGNPQQNNTQQIIPPNVPAASPISSSAPSPNTYKLTEQQKIVARASGLTDEEFVRGLTRSTIITV